MSPTSAPRDHPASGAALGVARVETDPQRVLEIAVKVRGPGSMSLLSPTSSLMSLRRSAKARSLRSVGAALGSTRYVHGRLVDEDPGALGGDDVVLRDWARRRSTPPPGSWTTPTRVL